MSMTAPQRLRSRLQKFLRQCARDSNSQVRTGPRSAGWLVAQRRLGVSYKTLQRVCAGQPITQRTVDVVEDALTRAIGRSNGRA